MGGCSGGGGWGEVGVGGCVCVGGVAVTLLALEENCPHHNVVQMP